MRTFQKRILPKHILKVYDNFKEDDVKKENEIIEFIEKKYEKFTTI